MKEYAAVGREWWYASKALAPYVISGMRFDTPEEAEKYGKKAFGEYYEGVIEFSK